MENPETVKGQEEFRNTVSTIGEKGKRIWLYPRKPKGNLYNYRTVFSWFQLAFLLLAPFIKIHGQPLIMLNIIERKFVIFGKAFWTQDFYIFALLLICFFLGIILFTAIFGRIWCGWLCPQTVFMEMLFRKVEYLIEGDWIHQKRLAKLPLKGQKLFKKILKYVIFFALSWVIGNVFLAYIIGGDALIELVTDDPSKHIAGLTAMVIFTLAFFWLYSYFREQFCTFLCPYARLQSVMLDDNSIVVAYDKERGENRAKARDRDKIDKPGDCVDCGICQQVCPTGIDIRNGFPQLECINCTACIDGCNTVMKRQGKEPGLIRYASRNILDNKSKFKITPRIIAYSTALVGLITFCMFLIFLRPDVHIKILRTPGQTFQLRENDRVSNLYNGNFINKTTNELNLKIECSDKDASITIIGQQTDLAPQQESKVTFFVELPKSAAANKVNLKFYIDGEMTEEKQLSFISPK